jgi:hypothetical protein
LTFNIEENLEKQKRDFDEMETKPELRSSKAIIANPKSLASPIIGPFNTLRNQDERSVFKTLDSTYVLFMTRK